MKVVVSGGMGFLGRWLLAETGGAHELTLLTRQPAMTRFEFLGQRAAVRQTDYSLNQLLTLLSGSDALVHLAAVRPHPGQLPGDFMPNRSVSQTLLQACLQAGISSVVLISSRAVYGRRNPSPWTEDQTPLPDSPYGQSKLDMEAKARQFLEQGLPVKCLRLAQLAGLGERGGYALMDFVKAASQGRTLQVFSSGADGREYLYVRDAARAILAALAQPLLSGEFNIGSETPISILQLARLVNRVFENEGNLEVGLQAAETGEMSWMSIAKSRQHLAWSPCWTLEQGLVEMRQMLAAGFQP